MKITVVAHGLHVAGGRSVAMNIITALGVVAGEHDYQLIMPAGVGYEALTLPPNVTTIFVAVHSGLFARITYDFLTLPKLVAKWQPDLIFCLGNYGLTLRNVKQAILFHKPHFVYPEVKLALSYKERLKNTVIKFQIQRSLKYTHIVFCQTSALANRFSQNFKNVPDVKLLPNVVSATVKSSLVDDALLPERLKHTLFNNKFKLFALTRYYSHKNLEILVQVFDEYRDLLKDVVCITTIDESEHKNAKVLLNNIKRLGLSNSIINIGPVEQKQLPTLYYFSDALILPTLLESFSGTYVEAMQYQKPILTSDRDFSRVVCGDAAMYFDPLSSEDIANKVFKLKGDARARAELIEKGRVRLSHMPNNWNSVVESAVENMLAL